MSYSIDEINKALSNNIIDENTTPQFISASKMVQQEASGLLDKSPKYQRPYTKQDGTKGYYGDAWQKALIVAFLTGKWIQPIHHRYNPLTEKWEIVDGGHRTRTLINFFKGLLKLPKGFQYEWEGKSYDLSSKTWTDIERHYDKLATFLINNNYFFVVRHTNMTDEQAKQWFCTLNNLNKITDADMRNAVSAEIADSCRTLGAVDLSKYEIFNSYSNGKMDYIGLKPIKRETDAFVTQLTDMVYLGDSWVDGSNPKWNQLYEDDRKKTEQGKSEFKLDGKVMKQVDLLLSHLNKMILQVKKERLKGLGKAFWKTHVMLKYLKFIKWIIDNNKDKDVVIDYSKFVREFQLSVSNIKMAHLEHERYDIKDGKVVPLGKAGIDSVPFPPHRVFTGGTRIDDYEFILKHVEVDYEPSKFGVSFSSKRSTFKKEDAWKAWGEQDGKCANCGKEIFLDAEDHIIPVKGNGKTEKENLQILCEDCNGDKSSSMTIEDLDKVIKTKSGRLTSEQIKKISEILN